MKKPNITEGDWEIKHEFHVVGNRTVANCGGYFNNLDSDNVRDENQANTQAISAVPEMLDALIKVSHAIRNYVEMNDDDLLLEVDEQVEQALEKAGVEFGTAQE